MAKEHATTVKVKGKECKLLRNQLLVGTHTGPDYEAEPDPETGKFPSKKHRRVTGEPAPVVRDIVNLETKLGEKFKCLDGPALKKPVATKKTPVDVTFSDDALDNQSAEELVEIAKSLSVELTGEEDADELRSKIREAS